MFTQSSCRLGVNKLQLNHKFTHSHPNTITSSFPTTQSGGFTMTKLVSLCFPTTMLQRGYHGAQIKATQGGCDMKQLFNQLKFIKSSHLLPTTASPTPLIRPMTHFLDMTRRNYSVRTQGMNNNTPQTIQKVQKKVQKCTQKKIQKKSSPTQSTNSNCLTIPHRTLSTSTTSENSFSRFKRSKSLRASSQKRYNNTSNDFSSSRQQPSSQPPLNQPSQQSQIKVPIDPVTGRPITSVLPPQYQQEAMLFKQQQQVQQQQLQQQQQQGPKPIIPILQSPNTPSPTPTRPKTSWLMYSFKSLIRLALVGSIIGGWGYAAFYLNPRLLARVVGTLLFNSEINYCIEPEHENEYFYPIDENDPYATMGELFKSHQQDVVKKLFHIVKELNFMESNYRELSSRLSLHYREILKVRAFKIDDLDLWLLPLHLTKSQKKIRDELAIDPDFPAQVDLEVLDYLRNEAMWTYWEIITTRASSFMGDEELLKAKFEDLIQLKHDIDQVIDILDLTTLIAYETKLFTYQYIPQTREEMAEWEQFKRIEADEKKIGYFSSLNNRKPKKDTTPPEPKQDDNNNDNNDHDEIKLASPEGPSEQHIKDFKYVVDVLGEVSVNTWLQSFNPTRNIFQVTVKPEESFDKIHQRAVSGKYESPAVALRRDQRIKDLKEKNKMRIEDAVEQMHFNAGLRKDERLLIKNEQFIPPHLLSPEYHQIHGDQDKFKEANNNNNNNNNNNFYQRNPNEQADERDGQYSQVLSVASREKELFDTQQQRGSVFNHNNSSQQQQQQSSTPTISTRGQYVDKYTNYGNKDLTVSFDSDLDQNELNKIDQLPSPSLARDQSQEKSHREMANKRYREEIRSQFYGDQSSQTPTNNNNNNNNNNMGWFNNNNSTTRQSPHQINEDFTFHKNTPKSSQQSASNSRYRELEDRLVGGTSGGGFVRDDDFEKFTQQQNRQEQNVYRPSSSQSQQGSPPSRW